jgi:hypothetical protein
LSKLRKLRLNNGYNMFISCSSGYNLRTGSWSKVSWVLTITFSNAAPLLLIWGVVDCLAQVLIQIQQLLTGLTNF